MIDLKVVFVEIAVIFVSIVLADYLKEEGKLSPARKTWLLIAIIFSIVSLALNFLQL